MSALDQYINTPEIQAAQQASDTATNTAIEYGSSMAGLPEKLRQAVLEKFNYNKDLIEQRNKAAADYFASPSADRVKYGDIGNPMLTEKLVAQNKAIMYEPWANLNDLLSARMGTIDKTAQGLADTAQAQYESTKFGAETARQKLLDLLGLAESRASYDLAAATKAGQGKNAVDKATDSILISQWLAGTDGLPGMEGVNIPQNREQALAEGRKLIERGFDASTVASEIDKYFTIKEAKNTGDPAAQARIDITSDITAAATDPAYIKKNWWGGTTRDSVALYNKLVAAYPEMSITEIKQIMEMNGWTFPS